MAVAPGDRHADELGRRVSALTHAMAGPLQLAVGYLSLLEHDRSDDRALERAHAAVLRAASMLAVLERTAAATSPPALVRCDPAAVVRDVLSTMREGVTPALDVRGGEDVEVAADRRQLSLVVESIALEHRPRRVEVGPEGDRWTFEASGGVAVPCDDPPLWELVVERHGGGRRPGVSAGFWLPRCVAG